MSSNVQCYLRTLRREWDLTQEELAALLPKASRNRVSRVERAKSPPNAQEILAYSLIFGSSPQAIFRQFCEATDESVMQGAYRLYQQLEERESVGVRRKRELLDQLRARAVRNASQTHV